jgi:hypothetical protein
MAFKFEKPVVWQKSFERSVLVTEVASKFRKDELYVLSSQSNVQLILSV